MQIQLNTDRTVSGSDERAAQVEAELQGALARFADRITRVEVHLNDVNSDKPGDADKRCMIEARPAGRQPLAATHQAPSVELALSGAADKLVRALDRLFGKADAERRGSAR